MSMLNSINLSAEQCKKLYDNLDISKLEHHIISKGVIAKISGLLITGNKRDNKLWINNSIVKETPENSNWYRAIIDKLYDLNNSWRNKINQIEEKAIITIINNL